MSIRLPLAFVLVLGLAPTVAAYPSETAPANSAPARARTLSVGDAAPALTVEAWLKGGPIDSFALGQVYLVDVWATWCGPCLRAAPQLGVLQEKYKDQGFVVIGLTATDKRGNTRRAAEKLLSDKPDLMSYAVAWDRERTTTNALMAASGRTSIPTVFLIDRAGKIAFIGHPEEVEPVLEQVLAGKHDLAALAAAYKLRAEVESREATLQQAYGVAFKKKDWAGVLDVADKLLAIDAEKYGVMAAMKFRVLVREIGDCDKAYAFARTYFEGPGKKDWMAMSAVAFEIVDPGSKIARRDLDYALALCLGANEMSGGQEAPVLDAIARVYYMKGDLRQAVAFCEKAAAIDKNLVGTLEQYRRELEEKK